MIFLEHYVTLFDDEEKKKKYLDQVWDILQKSYAPIGGIANMSEPEDLLDPELGWKMVTRGGKVVAVTIYKLRDKTRKIIAGGTDGTKQGKEDFYKMCAEEVKRIERNSWAEVSGSMEGIFLFKLGATPIPVEISNKILQDKGKDILRTDKDGFHYVRNIGGKPYEKIMFGNVPEKYRTDNWDTDSKKFKTQYDTYNQEHPEEVERRKHK